MDKRFLFRMVLNEAISYVKRLPDLHDELPSYDPTAFDDESVGQHFYSLLYEVNKRRDCPLPEFEFGVDNSATIEKIISHFKGNVALVSLMLSYVHPKKYLFYNPLTLEDEIFEGIQFFSDVVPEFREIEFDKVGKGKHAIERYFKFNEQLLKLSRIYWPEIDQPQVLVDGIIYNGLGSLFTEYSDYTRYWIIATGEEYFSELDTLPDGETILWSSRKAMQSGDVIFVYRKMPVGAVTDIFVAEDNALFHPLSAWDGYWVKMRRLTQIPAITFKSLREDPTLSSWWVIRKQFQGTVCDPINFRVYNRFLELLPPDLCREVGLKPEPVLEFGGSGEFDSEESFEDKIIVPILKRLDIAYQRQYPCWFTVGSQRIRGRVDFLLRRKNKPYSLIENKLRIVSDKELDQAVDQARSYALMLGLEYFSVASPEGFWFYHLQGVDPHQLGYLKGEEIHGQEETLNNLILGKC